MKKNSPKERENLLMLSASAWKPRVVQIAVRHRLFDFIDKWKSLEPVTARALSVRLGWEPRATELFLNALAAAGLLIKKKSEYRNAPSTREFLVTGRKGYLGHFFELTSSSWDLWGKLDVALRSGQSLVPPDFMAQDPERPRRFTLAMRDYTVAYADMFAKKMPLKKCRTLLDLGSGPGLFSIACLKASRKLEATLYDFPPVLEVSRQFVEEAGLSKRVYYQPGNFMQDPIPGVHDTVLLSHILHGLSEEECRLLLKKIADVVSEGGTLVIQDNFLDEEKIAPEFAAFFSLNMLLHTKNGRSYSAEEVLGWLKEAGFTQAKHQDWKLPRSMSVITAVKK